MDLHDSAESLPTESLPAEGWAVHEDGFDPARTRHQETVFTIGNGNFCVRGSFEEGHPAGLPASFCHRVWDDMPVNVTELANLPRWWGVDVWLDGVRFRLDQGTLTAFHRTLDLRTGVLTRLVRWRPEGDERELSLVFERFVALHDPHVAAVRVSASLAGGTGELRLRAPLDAHVENTGLLHWLVEGQASDAASASLLVRTRATRTRVGLAQAVRLAGSDAVGHGTDADGAPAVEFRLPLGPDAVTLTKFVAIVPDFDDPVPLTTASGKAQRAADAGWDALRAEHDAAWAEVWAGCDVEVEGDDEAQLALRHNTFQLLVAAPRFTDRASIGAKTLSGFGYRHHAFWDTESFMLPFFTFTDPAVARNMLLYRWHGLPAARAKASANGYAGAQFPWESAGDGSEVTPTWLPDPADPGRLVRIWTGDIEIHITADIAYAIAQYWRVTGDDAFLRDHGAEMVLDGATFYASAATRDADGSYHYRDVVGPDEYHEHVDDNAYTNHLARWHLRFAAEVLAWLRDAAPARARELEDRLGLDEDRLALWSDVADHLHVPVAPESGLVEQFTGYFDLTDVDLELARDPGRTASMQQIYGIEATNRTQNVKQPDVLQLQFVLPGEFTPEQLLANYRYYDPRTDHEQGSSLGPAVSAIVACRVGDAERAYEHFLRAARADLLDVRGNASDGIHGASAGGLWQAAVLGFGGFEVAPDGFTTRANLPSSWRSLTFTVTVRGIRHRVTVR